MVLQVIQFCKVKMTETKSSNNIISLFKTKLEKRVLEHFEAVIDAYAADDPLGIDAQKTLLSKSLESIVKIYEEGGYKNARGRHVPLNPRDLLFLQQTMENAFKLRADILMLPHGMSNVTEIMETIKNLESKDIGDNKNVGLKEAPPLVPLDAEQDAEEFPDTSNVYDQEYVEKPTIQIPLLPKKQQ